MQCGRAIILQPKKYGIPDVISSQKPTKLGYEFLGWSTTTSASVPEYASGDSYTEDKGVTLYAVWRYIPKTYEVRYNANGGGNAPTSQTKTEDHDDDQGTLMTLGQEQGLIIERMRQPNSHSGLQEKHQRCDLRIRLYVGRSRLYRRYTLIRHHRQASVSEKKRRHGAEESGKQ